MTSGYCIDGKRLARLNVEGTSVTAGLVAWHTADTEHDRGTDSVASPMSSGAFFMSCLALVANGGRRSGNREDAVA